MSSLIILFSSQQLSWLGLTSLSPDLSLFIIRTNLPTHFTSNFNDFSKKIL
jgi:hypothetical protein